MFSHRSSSSSSIAVLQLKGWRHVWPFSNCPCLPQILLHRWSAIPSSHWCLPSIVSLVAPYLCSLERSPVWCPSLSNLLSSLYVHSSSDSMFLCELTVTFPLLALIVPIRLFCDLSTKLSILFGSTTSQKLRSVALLPCEWSIPHFHIAVRFSHFSDPGFLKESQHLTFKRRFQMFSFTVQIESLPYCIFICGLSDLMTLNTTAPQLGNFHQV